MEYMVYKSLEITKTRFGYSIFFNRKLKIIKSIINIIVLLFIGFCISFIDFENIIIQMKIIIRILSYLIIIFCIYHVLFFNIYIKIYNNKIVFHISSKPLNLENIEVYINNLKEISINYETDYEEDRGLTYYYNLDLIDNKYNAYRIMTSTDYNETFHYGNKISEIINIELVDKNDIEGYGNIYNKRII